MLRNEVPFLVIIKKSNLFPKKIYLEIISQNEHKNIIQDSKKVNSAFIKEKLYLKIR